MSKRLGGIIGCKDKSLLDESFEQAQPGIKFCFPHFYFLESIMGAEAMSHIRWGGGGGGGGGGMKSGSNRQHSRAREQLL